MLESQVRKEQARITEQVNLNQEVRVTVEKKIEEIDKLVYQDTIAQHKEKNRLDD